MYYNTNKEDGDILKESHEKTDKQEAAILEFFQKNPMGIFSPDEVQQKANLYTAPLTSIRRAITNLTIKGYLKKCGKELMKKGTYGKKVHTWELADKSCQKPLFI